VAESRRLVRLGPGSSSFFHTDALGSTRLVTNKAGHVIGEYDYGVWGENVRTLNPSASAYRYAGSRLDGPGTLAHVNAREYDPNLGRFVSADAIVPELYTPQSLNRYAYVLNDPVSATDKSGYVAECIPEEWGVDCSLRRPATPRFDEPATATAPAEPRVPSVPHDLYGEERRQYARELWMCGTCHAYDPNNPNIRPVTPEDRQTAAVGLVVAVAPVVVYAGAEILGSGLLLEGGIIVYRAAPVIWDFLLAVGGALAGVPSAGPAPASAAGSDKAVQAIAVVESKVMSNQAVQQELSAAEQALAHDAEMAAARAVSAKLDSDIKLQNWMFERYGIWGVGKSPGGSFPMRGSFPDEIQPPAIPFQLTRVGDKVVLTQRK
jgi:RHS repeat-associated protein